jgi:hypothetical protein
MLSLRRTVLVLEKETACKAAQQLLQVQQHIDILQKAQKQEDLQPVIKQELEIPEKLQAIDTSAADIEATAKDKGACLCAIFH